MRNSKTTKPQFGNDIMTATKLIKNIIHDLVGDESRNITTNMYGDVGVEIKAPTYKKSIILPNLIVITCNDLNTTKYYAYNNKSYEKFDIESYADFYDEVSESTGKELESIFERTYSQRKRKK